MNDPQEEYEQVQRPAELRAEAIEEEAKKLRSCLNIARVHNAMIFANEMLIDELDAAIIREDRNAMAQAVVDIVNHYIDIVSKWRVEDGLNS